MSDRSAPLLPCLTVVLAGGLGTRISHLIPELPKPLAVVAGKPFIEWVVRYLYKQDIRQIVFSTYHYAAKVNQFADGLKITGLNLMCVEETSPLGTAGGFLNALEGSGDQLSNTLVLNGDSIVLTNLESLLGALNDPRIDGAMLGVHVNDAARFGTINVDREGVLCGFKEKRVGAGLISGGVYLFRRAIVDRFPGNRPLSFEHEVFPALLANGVRIRVVPCDAPFLDIGTEDSLAQAGVFIKDNMKWFE